MKINNILVTGRLYKDLETAIALKNNRQRQYRFLAETEVSLADIRWADAFVAFKPTPNFEFADLKWVHALGAGVDNFVFNKKWKKDVILTRTLCSFGQKISEYCLSYILRNLQLQDRLKESQAKFMWTPVEPQLLSSQKIVVFGTGSIGQKVAANLSYFGAEVSGVSLSGEFKAPFGRVVNPTDLRSVLKHADWIINTLPLTNQTQNFFNDEIFSTLEDACFINVGRGLSVNEKALLRAIDKGNLRLAVLDVFQEEPLPAGSSLWMHDKVVITPHISAITAVSEAVECFLETLERVEASQVLPNRVNIDRGY